LFAAVARYALLLLVKIYSFAKKPEYKAPKGDVMPSQGTAEIYSRPSASIQAAMVDSGTLRFKITGRLDANSTGEIWRGADQELGRTAPLRIVIDASDVVYCDGSGIGFLFELRRRQQKAGGKLEILGLQPRIQHLLDLFDPSEFEESPVIKPEPISFAEKIGRSTCQICEHAYALIEFVGEAGAALVDALLNPRKVRWKDAFLAAETAGVDALPVIGLIGFLMGLIMAFQAAISMRSSALRSMWQTLWGFP
jgi:phospholipid/cholesterol/gamma-HCH transport system permease protein